MEIATGWPISRRRSSKLRTTPSSAWISRRQGQILRPFRDRLNERQARVIARMFREGIDGFKGGLSADNYISITEPRADRHPRSAGPR